MPKEEHMSSLSRIVLSLLVLLVITPAFADGPVSSLPGVSLISDGDGGNGERWGRAGGRSLVYAVTNPTAYSALSFGVVNGTVPSAAFDGTVNPGEMLAFSMGDSNLGGGVARWVGSAQITLINPTRLVTLQTRFTLTAASSFGPVALTFTPGGVSPGLNALTNSPFTANLLFETFNSSSIGGNDQWKPILDFFDQRTDTQTGLPPGQGGPVMTSVQTGFYFTNSTVPAGLSLQEHDTNVTNRLISIKGDTDFTRLEMGRLPGMSSNIIDIKNAVMGLGNDPNDATRDDVNSASQQLQQILFILFGLAPCPPEAGPLCENAKFVKDLSTQVSVDNVRTSVESVLTRLNAVDNQLDAIESGHMNGATRNDVNSASNQLQETLFILFGLMPCPPEAGGLCTSAKFIKDLSTQASVDGVRDSVGDVLDRLSTIDAQLEGIEAAVNSSATPYLDVETTDAEPASNKQRRWIVKTALDGVLANAQIVRVTAIRTSSKQPSVAQDVTYLARMALLSTGLTEVTLELVKDVSEGSAYLFEVRQTVGASTISGTALVDADKKD
jgi:hypothetical protein